MSPRTLHFVLLTGLASGCGPTLLEYDERTAELRRTEDHLAQALVAEKSAEKEFVDASARLAEEKAHALTLERELQSVGIHKVSDITTIKDALAAEERVKALATRTESERSQLQGGLTEEIEGGVVRIEVRDGSVRLVMPEEALFAIGASRLAAPAKKILESVARELARVPTRRLLVSGHTDGKTRNGWALSVERARQVLEVLVARGVDPGRVAAAGYAEYDPIADNTTDDGRARNRRIEVVLLSSSPDFVPSVPSAPPPAPPAPLAKTVPVAKTPKTPPISSPNTPTAAASAPVSAPQVVPTSLDDPGL